MRTSTLLASLALAVAAQVGCGGGDTSGSGGGTTTTTTGGAGGTTSSGGTTASGGATGGTTSSGGTTATGGPFTSEGTSAYETQTSLAADTKGGVVATWIAFNADNTSAIGYAVSRDGGKHWTDPKTIASPGGGLASNPVVVADSQGRFTLAWLGFKVDFNNPDEHVYVSRLDNATDTFGAPAVASDDDGKTTYDLDKPSLAVDATDALLLTWADFTGSGSGTPASTKFARSTDGQTFQRVTVTNDATFGNLASLCVDTTAGAGATLFLVHLGANGTVTLRTSVNQGQSWEIRPTPAMKTVFQDITCAVKGTKLWIAYASGTAMFTPGQDSPGDTVQVMYSPNEGTSFDAPVTVAADVGSQYLYPKLVRAPSGKLEVVYYEGLVGGEAKLTLASSADGKAWSKSPIAVAGTFTLDRTIASWLGAYVGFAIPGDKGYTSYADNSSNKAHIAFAEIALP
ncbi:MAG: sialidase family protein [Polyangiaceae bacterium]